MISCFWDEISDSTTASSLEYSQRGTLKTRVVLGGSDMRLTSAITREGLWFVARCLEVEVTSQGETLESAMSNLQEALELYFEDHDVPTGMAPIIAPVEVNI